MFSGTPAQLVDALGVGLTLNDLEVLLFLADDCADSCVTTKREGGKIPGRRLHQGGLTLPLEFLSSPLENVPCDSQYGPAVRVAVQLFL